MEWSIQRLDTTHADFDARLAQLKNWDDAADRSIETAVREIINAVRMQGDAAVIRLTNQFDDRDTETIEELRVEDFSSARKFIPPELDKALEDAAGRIRRFHERQLQNSWDYEEDDGTVLGQVITPLDSVGVYVPGGKAAYPSSVLMNVIPSGSEPCLTPTLSSRRKAYYSDATESSCPPGLRNWCGLVEMDHHLTSTIPV